MGKLMMGITNKITLILVMVAVLLSQSAAATEQQRRQAKRIHDRLTGVSASNGAITIMEGLLASDSSGRSAAAYAIDETVTGPNAPAAYGFYSVTLKNWAAPWTNEAQSVFAPLNDYSATIVGAVRDGIDFREILHGNLLYTATPATGVTGYAPDNNLHYEQLEARSPDPAEPIGSSGNLANSSVLRATTQTSVGVVAPAGIMTTRAAAKAFFSGGTNRAMFRFTLMNHLCTDLEPLKDVTRTPDHVRRDTSRSPGGDSRLFQTGCVGCHAGMDGMANAFAKYEWDEEDPLNADDGRMLYNLPGNPLFGSDGTGPGSDGIPDGISLKHNINATNFEYGYAVVDDNWVNYWRNGPNSKLGNRPGDNSPGWTNSAAPLDSKGNATGSGASELGMELANTKAFAQCQVDKAFKAICLRDPNVMLADRLARNTIVDSFVGSTYNMRGVFTDVAAHCKGS